MADIFAEADDALRRERAAKFWTKHRFAIIGTFTAIIIGTGAYSGWKSWDKDVKIKQTAALMALQAAPDYPENILKLEKLPYRSALNAIAFLDAAGAFMDKKAPDKALKLYERVANEADFPAEFKDLATLMTVRLKYNAKTAKPEELLASLAPLLDNASNPWSPHAKIEAAVITANELKDTAKAREILNSVQDTPALPQSLYEKAQYLDHIYGLRGGKTISEKPKTDSKS